MPRKVVSVYLSPKLTVYLDKLIEKLGLSESEILRQAFVEYVIKQLKI